MLFSYPDDNKSRSPWNIVPLRLLVQGILLPLLVIAVPVLAITFPVWYYGGALSEEIFKDSKPVLLGRFLEE